MKINNSRGGLTDISAKKEALRRTYNHASVTKQSLVIIRLRIIALRLSKSRHRRHAQQQRWSLYAASREESQKCDSA